ncbi:PREDICTED: uncharacterized protein LOC106789185 [Polistes canadensis]|uniref:uncharacterized protein LOC106789185 n=1 Tax=Polistes canadensis TaxID=91411 RepID=UPI000718E7DF|nr:PREDICTED: uncharacterized protein LOC106789185 [Polistes canadensis]
MSTISLNEHCWVDGIYCKELDFEFDVEITEKDKLKNLYDPFFTSDTRYSVSMLLLFDQLSLRLTDDVVKLLQNWYPTKKVNVWGGMLHQISICDSNTTIRPCQDNMNFISILLSGRNMESWYLALGPYHKNNNRISYRFKIFSLGVQLRKHSVAFMFTSDSRGEKFYYYEASVFEKYFPKIPLVKICGMSAIGGENLSG